MSFFSRIKALVGLDFTDQARREVALDEERAARRTAERFSRGSVGIQKGTFQTRGDLDEALKRVDLPPTLPREEEAKPGICRYRLRGRARDCEREFPIAMTTLSAKEKWLIEAGIKILRDPSAESAWLTWISPQNGTLLEGGFTAPLPAAIAAIVITALNALAEELRRALSKTGIPDQEEDDIVNDLEVVELIHSNITSRFGHPTYP